MSITEGIEIHRQKLILLVISCQDSREGIEKKEAGKKRINKLKAYAFINMHFSSLNTWRIKGRALWISHPSYALLIKTLRG